MQGIYKTISSLEFDVLSGTYKQVDKQVQDESASVFVTLLEARMSDESGGEVLEFGEALQSSSSQNSQSTNTPSFKSDFTSSLYAYRFRQNEAELLNLQTKQDNATNANDLLKGLI